MKILGATFLMAMLAAAPAAASSFVMLKRADTQPSPSIILFVEPEAAAAAAPPPASRQELLGAAPAASPPPAPSLAVPMPQRFAHVSASVIALGEPAVEPTIVAAIAPEQKAARNPHLPPMVIRGGIFGAAFLRGDGMERPLAGEPAPELVHAPESEPGPAQGPGGQRQPEPPKAPPPPPPQGPAAPTRLPE